MRPSSQLLALAASCSLLSLLLSLSYTQAFNFTPGNVLLLDHLNINHEKSRHDLLRAFYFDTLGLAIDPRKTENLEKGRKTLWANAGITQFHLPGQSMAVGCEDEERFDEER